MPNREPGNQPEDRRNTRPPDNSDDIEIDRALAQEGAGPDDEDRNPGIGASKGTSMADADPDDLADEFDDAENTFEGDVENDAGRPGTGVDPRRRGRENT